MNKIKLLTITIGLLLYMVILGCADGPPEDIAAPADMQSTKAKKVSVEDVSRTNRANIQSSRFRAGKKMQDLYVTRNYKPQWIGSMGPLPQAYEMVEVIKNSYNEGLDPQSYKLKDIERTLSSVESSGRTGGSYNINSLSELDLLLSNAFISYANDIYYGRVRPESISIDLLHPERPVNMSEILLKAVSTNTVTLSLNNLLPKYPVYGNLKNSLANYRQLAVNGGWERIPYGADKLKKGARSPRVVLLKKRLSVTGEFTGGNLGEDRFDETLELAVKKYQEINGLHVDGVVGKSTLESLNVSAQQRVEQLVLSMERLRILPHYLGDRYILVNIANFHLYAIENNRNALAMRIVVGKPEWNTPIFGELMTHVVINPSWTIPRSILKDDIIPRVRTDPNYLSKRNIIAIGLKVEPVEEESPVVEENIDIEKTVVESGDPNAELSDNQESEDSEPEPTIEDIQKARYNSAVLTGKYTLRQEPGPSNPLGRIKFLFPNKYSVYLHDTPNRGFFKRAQRNFSHGCIRVEHPRDLAEFVLYSNPGWDETKIRANINSGRTRTVYLDEHIPVYVLYFTAWSNEDGTVGFHDDIYGHDALLQNALRRLSQNTDIANRINQ